MSPRQTEVVVKVATPAIYADLVRFFRAVEAGEHPDEPQAPQRGEAGLRRSLSTYDFLSSDSAWLLLARVKGEPAGYALVVRIPKADARAGFLFVDELYVLPSCRRQGVGRSLVTQAQALASALGLAGVRLLVRLENRAARALFRQAGFSEEPAVFCEWGEGGVVEVG